VSATTAGAVFKKMYWGGGVGSSYTDLTEGEFPKYPKDGNYSVYRNDGKPLTFHADIPECRNHALYFTPESLRTKILLDFKIVVIIAEPDDISV
jgi:hypothetical protein